MVKIGTERPTIEVNEIFVGIQGEGRYTGYPALFVRLSGCNQSCLWCDTQYHYKVDFACSPEVLALRISTYGINKIIWTGGEPLLQMDMIRETMDALSLMNGDEYEHHIETNGTILDVNFLNDQRIKYIAFSPKSERIMEDLKSFLPSLKTAYDIKVVTDGETIGMRMIDDATILMPLTSTTEIKNLVKLDENVRKTVWNLAIKKRKRLSLRIHNIVWGNERGK
jgi:7-carboxy-7-deazaguanine synthase